MKKALLVSVVLLAFTLPVLAGPYFSLENTGLTLAPEFTVGYDGGISLAEAGFALSGDVSVTKRNVFARNSFVDIDLLGTVAWSMVKMEAGFGFVYKPGSAKADDFLASFKIVGMPVDFLTIYGSVDIPVVAGPLSLEPVLGIECRW